MSIITAILAGYALGLLTLFLILATGTWDWVSEQWQSLLYWIRSERENAQYQRLQTEVKKKDRGS